MVRGVSSIGTREGLAILLPFLIYSITVWVYASRQPLLDDYSVVLGFVSEYFGQKNSLDGVAAITGVGSDQSGSRLPLIFSLHNEHRLVFPRWVILADHQIFGRVDISHLIYFGNLAWIGCFWVLFIHARRLAMSARQILTISLVMACLFHWEIMTWATGALQQYWQLLFSLLSLWCLASRAISGAALFYVFATITGGGGLLVGPVLVLVSVLAGRFRDALLMLTLTAVLAYGYFVFLGYQRPPHHPDIIESLIQPVRLIMYFFAFLGAGLHFKWIALTAGIVVALLAAVFVTDVLRRDRVQENFFEVSVVALIFLTAVVGALTRSGLGVEQAASSRYSIYGVTLAVVVYMGWVRERVELFSEPVNRYGLITALFTFAAVFPVAIWKLAECQQRLESGQIVYPDPAAARERLNLARPYIRLQD